MSEEETEYLRSYSIESFARPSIATDIVVFSVMDDGKACNYRKSADKALKVLLVKRANYPYMNWWSLPGGFCRPGEDVIETARRELLEETNIKRSYLALSGIFGEEGRDPRGWIISNTYLALVNAEEYEVRGGQGAWEARWFKFELHRTDEEKVVAKDNVLVKNRYELVLFSEELGLSIGGQVMEYKEFKEYHEKVRYEIVSNEKMAFDHLKILLHTFLKLQKEAENDYRLPFDLMGETFSLTQLQNTFELVLGHSLLTPNFRRKIMPMVEETDDLLAGEGHRPAKLFKRKLEEFAG